MTTDITLYDQASLERIRSVDGALLEADHTGDTEAILTLLPISEQFWSLVEVEATLRRALNDWRIAKHGVWREAGAASTYAYFLEEAASNEYAQSVVTRLQNVQTIHFFYWEQGWGLEKLRAAGISRMRQYVSTCRKMVAEDGRIDPSFELMLCDPDIPTKHVYERWREQKRAEAEWEAVEQGDEGEGKPGRGEAWERKPTVYGYANHGTIELVAWVPAGEGVVTVEVGYILNTADVAPIWQQVVDGEIKVRMR